MVRSRDAESTERSRGGSQRSAANGLVGKWLRLSYVSHHSELCERFRTDKLRIRLCFVLSGKRSFSEQARSDRRLSFASLNDSE